MSDWITYPYEPPAAATLAHRAAAHYQTMDARRSIREFSDRPVARSVMEHLLLTASTAPSGAHKQPWTFCAVSSPSLKAKIREAAEAEEYRNYQERMNAEWLEDLAPFGTDWQKPFLEIAPWLIIVFKQAYGLKNGQRAQHYYVNESVGIACGMLISAIHQAGLVTLTHTPSPMKFLSGLLNRPANEQPFLLLPVGYPKAQTQVPSLQRKPLQEMAVFFED